MRLSHLPHIGLVLGCDQSGAVWVTQQFVLVNLRHTADFLVLPFGGILLIEECFLLFSECNLHRLVLLIESLEFVGDGSDTFTLASTVLKELDLVVFQVRGLLCKLGRPLRENLFRCLVKEPDLL